MLDPFKQSTYLNMFFFSSIHHLVILAMCIPMLNLLMDLVGSISGTMLSIILPPLIHLAAFWEDTCKYPRENGKTLNCFIVKLLLINN